MLLKMFLIFAFLGSSWCKDLLATMPLILQNTTACPLNPCEIVKIISTHLYQNSKPMRESEQNMEKWAEQYGFGLEIEHRLNLVEQRLRSIEQPLWKLKAGSNKAWELCTEGVCRCDSTKRMSCWRKDLRTLPPNQLVPNDILAM